ncbi:hypothetical protein GCM10027589_09880 [Actinocorallia lasiicapitis]
MAKPAKPPTVRLRRFGAEMLRLRNEAGLTRDEVEAQTKINGATLYRVETARVRPQVRTATTLMELYRVPQEDQERLLALLRDSSQRGGWINTFKGELPERYTTYIYFEEEADTVWNYQAAFVPGLLQTKDYAEAVIRGTLPEATDDEIRARVEARINRQELLYRQPLLKLWLIIDEAVLVRTVGSPALLAEQLGHLIKVSRLPNVTLQVVPFDAGGASGHAGVVCGHAIC